MQQSSHLIAGLPACLLAAVSLAILPDQAAEAQNQYRVTRRENFRREPGPDGRLLASVSEGAEVMGGETRSGWVEVTLEGWIWRQSLRSIDRAQYDYEVSAGSGENLRVRPNGPILARLSTGFWLQEIETSGEWVKVKRVGWMWGRSLEPAAAGQELARALTLGEGGGSTLARPQTETSGDSRPTIDRAVTLGRSAMRAVPSGDTTAVLAGGAPLTILARSGPWVRVRSEGWVHESNLRPVSTDVLVGVSGAEVRAQPERFEGRVLQWTVQLLAVQTSDGLRQEIPTGQRYILARGPLPEAGFVYVLLDDEHREEIERLSPLAQLVVLVRVKVGCDRYLCNPVVELIEMSVRER
jgi:hypothetical protein